MTTSFHIIQILTRVRVHWWPAYLIECFRVDNSDSILGRADVSHASAIRADGQGIWAKLLPTCSCVALLKTNEWSKNDIIFKK